MPRVIHRASVYKIVHELWKSGATNDLVAVSLNAEGLTNRGHKLAYAMLKFLETANAEIRGKLPNVKPPALEIPLPLAPPRESTKGKFASVIITTDWTGSNPRDVPPTIRDVNQSSVFERARAFNRMQMESGVVDQWAVIVIGKTDHKVTGWLPVDVPLEWSPGHYTDFPPNCRIVAPESVRAINWTIGWNIKIAKHPGTWAVVARSIPTNNNATGGGLA